MELNSDLLVKDLIEAINNKQIKVEEVAKFFGVSTRTYQKKISSLDIKWNSTATRYEIPSASVVGGIKLGDLFKKGSLAATTSAVKPKEKAAPKTTPKPTPNNAATTTQQLDRIDILLQGKKESKKYVGFYAESDVLEVLDNVEGRVKSELINECLRVVFKDKGLL